ncbi:hypothetical protein M5E06_04845 [Azospirillum sp. A1-3]|nr:MULTISPECIES: hypothetical protein [unclassified Azospirillum]MCM8733523.1 hypothetical protein [Azospirillum sp. A1-3]
MVEFKFAQTPARQPARLTAQQVMQGWIRVVDDPRCRDEANPDRQTVED